MAPAAIPERDPEPARLDEGNLASRLNLAPAWRALAFAGVLLPAIVALPVSAADFTKDFGPTCTTMSIAGRTITCDDGTTLTLHSSVTPGCVVFTLVPQGTNYDLECLTPNATGLWWRPAEDGRGTWVSHQGNTIFAVDYSYDATGTARWRTLIAFKSADGTFAGNVYSTKGPSFQAAFDAHGVTPSLIGTGWIALDDADHMRANFAETGPRALVRQQFGPLPTCTFGQLADLTAATNYTDLWWNPNEPGWGINLAHQGDTIFAAWYTYAADGNPLWLVVTAIKTDHGTYEGDLYQATGPAGPTVKAAAVGAATFTFTNGNSASFSSSVELPGMAAPVTQVKSITRQVFTAPGAACR